MNDKLTAARWRKSSACSSGQCVEVAFIDQLVAVRDSKQQGVGPVLIFSRDEWSAFLTGVTSGEFAHEDGDNWSASQASA